MLTADVFIAYIACLTVDALFGDSITGSLLLTLFDALIG